ncbi:hypothetical protein Tco_1223497 [Tanacetum coccineum]
MSPTKSLFDVGSRRISIFIVNTFVSLGCSGNTTRIMRRTLKIFTCCHSVGGGGGGSVDVVLVVAIKLEGTSADAVRALKKFVLCKELDINKMTDTTKLANDKTEYGMEKECCKSGRKDQNAKVVRVNINEFCSSQNRSTDLKNTIGCKTS